MVRSMAIISNLHCVFVNFGDHGMTRSAVAHGASFCAAAVQFECVSCEACVAIRVKYNKLLNSVKFKL